jgi:hypothetical protein
LDSSVEEATVHLCTKQDGLCFCIAKLHELEG